jgi:gliding motility-associated-like protein
LVETTTTFIVINEDVSDGGVCPETITRTYQVTDSCGNTYVKDYIFTIIDETKPIFVGPTSITAQCSAPPAFANLNAFLSADGYDIIDCKLNTSSFSVQTEAPIGGPCNQRIVRRYSVEDMCGNISVFTQTITIRDTEKPVFVRAPQNQTVTCNIPTPYQNYNEFASDGWMATDNCGLNYNSFRHVSDDTTSFSCPIVVYRTYAITDNCGNTAELKRFITAIDEEPPTINAPANMRINIGTPYPDAAVNYAEFTAQGGTAFDNCEIDTASLNLIDEVTYTSTDADTIVRTYEISDACGNTSTDAQVIIINKLVPAYLINSPDLYIECRTDLGTPFTTLAEFIAGGGFGYSSCGFDQSTFAMVSESSDGLRCPETVTRTYQIVDLCGDTATATQTIYIHDLTEPTISCPANVSISYEAGIPEPFTDLAGFIAGGGQANDNCGLVNETFTLVDESYPPGTCPEQIIRTYEIADSCGNTAQCQQVITVLDNVGPEMTAPADIEIVCLGDTTLSYASYAEFVAAGGSASDQSGIVESSFGLYTVVQTTTANGAEVIRTYAIKDSCDNIGVVEHRIIALDDEPPIAVCNDITVTLNESGVYQLTDIDLQTIGSGSSDNCTAASDLLFSVSISQFDCADINGFISVVLTVTDEGGNSSTCNTTIQVLDTIVPTVNCKDITTYLGANGQVTVSASQLLDTYDDNCSIASILVNKGDFDCTNIGDNLVSITVTDLAGNSATCNSTVTIADTIPPRIVCQDIELFLDASDVLSINESMIVLASSDECGIASVELSQTDFNCLNVGQNSVTVTATDVNGNVSTCIAQVTIYGNSRPDAQDDTETIIHNLPTIIDILANDTDPNSSIDASTLTITNQPSNGTVVINSDFTVTYTPNTDYTGTDAFTYSICDDGIPCDTLCDEALVQLAVLPPNEPPTVMVDNFTGSCNNIVGSLTINDFDPNGDQLIINTTLVVEPTQGTLTIFDDGTFRYEFERGIAYRDSFIYEVCDDNYNSMCTQGIAYISIFADSDCDGVADSTDIDDDNDGIVDWEEGDRTIDSDGDGVPNSLDIDSDNDGIIDNIEAQAEGEYVAPSGLDENRNGLDDIYEQGSQVGIDAVDTDGDGTPDYLDADSDNDGVPDSVEGYDIGAKGIAELIPEYSDIDGDGLDDAYDNFFGNYNTNDPDNPYGTNPHLQDFDNDGIRDWRDTDDDNDLIPTKYEDLNNNNIYYDDDIDFDGHPEYLDFQEDCELFIPEGFSPNGDGIHDFFQIVCIDKYPNAKLLIFDRWGESMYEHEHYGNLSFWGSYEKAWWDGSRTNEGQFDSEKLPVGNYLYILIKGDGNMERGFVMISY